MRWMESENENIDRGLRMVNIIDVVDGVCGGMNRPIAIPICLCRLVQAILFQKAKEPQQIAPSLLKDNESSRNLFYKLLMAALIKAAY